MGSADKPILTESEAQNFADFDILQILMLKLYF